MEIHFANETIKSVGLFFEFSPKRQRQLETSIKEENDRRKASSGDEQEIPFKKVGVLCDTRWVECHTTLDDFHTLYHPVIDCLDAIIHSGRYDSKSVTEANGLFSAITSGKFLVAIRFMSSFLISLSRHLQGTSQDIIVAYDELQLVVNQLSDVRVKAAEEFKTLFRAMVDNHGEEPFSIPRRCGRQTMRANVPAEETKAYWRLTYTWITSLPN